jgi:tetratricopeptide (TPR) repeat protein
MLDLIFWLFVVGVFIHAAWQMWTLVWLPRQAQDLFQRGQRIPAIKLLEKVIATRSLGSGELKSLLRYQLAWFHMADGRYDEAAAQVQMALARRLKPPVEASMRQRLAECLEGMGDGEGAAEERRKAEQCLTRGRRGWDWYSNRAEALDTERKYEEAREAYGEALKRAPGWIPGVRPQIRLRLALACYNAGRPEEALRWAEEEIAGKADPQFRMIAHGIAGVACVALGRLDDAELHRQTALELAERAENSNLAGEYLAQLADVQMKRGKLVEALQTCEKAAGMSLAARRQARVVEAECLAIWGRFDQARDTYEQVLRTQPYPEPSLERRFRAVVAAFGQVPLEIEAGQLRAALQYLEESAEESSREVKLGFGHDSVRTRVLAMLGQEEEVRQMIPQLEERAAQLASDGESQRGYRSSLAHTYFALGDFVRSRAEWEAYLALQPDPVYQPTGLYHLGECLLRLNDVEGAKGCFRQAVEINIDTHYARKARQRLEETGKWVREEMGK